MAPCPVGVAYLFLSVSSESASLAKGPAGGRGKARKELVLAKTFLHPEMEVQATEVSRTSSGVCHKTPITSVVPSSVRRAVVNSWPTQLIPFGRVSSIAH